MPTPEIEEFAKLIVEHIRDCSVRDCDRYLHAENRGPVAKRWKAVAGETELKTVASVVIPDVVDSVVAQLFWAIDEGLLNLSFTASNGNTVDLEKDGLHELCGWYMGTEGWREMYSKERFVDDFADLKDYFINNELKEQGNQSELPG
jgi:hypothetical protein